MTARRRCRWPFVVVALLAGAFALLWWFPARWAWALCHDRYPAVQATAWHGSVWEGRVDGLSVAGQALGTLRWTLGHAALLGRLHGHFDLRGPVLIANGHIARDDEGAIVGEHLHFSLPAARLPASLFSGMRAGGTLHGDLPYLRVRRWWPTRLLGVMMWQSATLAVDGGVVRLGDLQARWHEAAGSMLRAELRDIGDGPLRLRGTFSASPLGWRLHATMTPRADHARLRRALRRLGATEAGRGMRLERHGGLMTGDAP